MSMLKDIPELIEAGVITPEIAENIRGYYANKGDSSKNRLFVIFGVLGAILVGLGIILIIAHNWDEFSRTTKTIFSFIPLLIGQLMAGYTILKKSSSVAWRESAGVFLFFGVGVSISLVGQVYNIAGDLPAFLLAWMLLSLPVIYLLQSSGTSLLYIMGITYYMVQSYMGPGNEELYYSLMLLLVLPYYYWLFRKAPNSNFLNFHHWMIPISITITLASWMKNGDPYMVIGYMSLFGLFYQIGQMEFWQQGKLRNNAYRALGSLGTVVLLLGLSFEEIWRDLVEWRFEGVYGEPSFFLAIILTLLAMTLVVVNWLKMKDYRKIKPITPIFLIFVILYVLGLPSSIGVVVINVLVLAIGLLTIREGGKMNNLGVLNYGVLIIAALVMSRFFDSHISFVVRGLMFMAVGAGFFGVNYWMLQKRKKHEI